jgi:hypothetical protein
LVTGYVVNYCLYICSHLAKEKCVDCRYAEKGLYVGAICCEEALIYAPYDICLTSHSCNNSLNYLR